jgi:bacillolysin
MRAFRLMVIAALSALLTVPAAPAAEAPDAVASSLEAMVASVHGNVEANASPETGAFDFVRVTGDAVLAADDATQAPKTRALAFLRRHGAAMGMSARERSSIDGVLRLREVYRDAAGNSHVRLDQIHRGAKVFGGQLVVHMNARGITGVNGIFVPHISVPRSPAVKQARAQGIAMDAVAKAYETTQLAAETPHLTVYRSGLVEGRSGANSLAWETIVNGPAIRDRVWVDATRGIVLQRMETIEPARDRIAYSPQYDPNNPDRFAHRHENDPESHIPPVDKLFDFTGQVYDFFSKSFGRDSFDNKGHTMRTVYLVNEVCPNAYWNSSTTNYCPGFDADDVVAHEWGHAFTEYTHGLHYLCQPGALNESYSDIWGETVDLLNGMDGIGGTVNDKTYPDGQRWLVGEDLGQAAQELLLRDMWDPVRLGDPGKVSDSVYVCGAADAGGVHTNSGIPNHAFAMLVDGKTYNGRTIKSIGLTKAAHIYYQAMTAYQTETSGFAVHEQSLKAACRDLTGVNLKALMTGAASGERIMANDCVQVAQVSAAVEFSKPAIQCAFKPLLSTEAIPICPAAKVAFRETWESGSNGWTFGNQGSTQDFPGTKWIVKTALPKGRPGHASYAEDPNGGVCLESRGNWSGRFWADSPEVTIPQDAQNLTLRFDHYVATESADGGNVLASVNDGAFALLNTYVFNGPNGTLPESTPLLGGNTNPKAAEVAWFGADPGEVTGTWGTTIADLKTVAQPGDKIRLRFDFGIDQCGGVDGWYVDDIAIYSCPPLPPPVVSLREYANPDPDRAVLLSWTRPEGAVGPDEVQGSSGPRTLLTEDAESGLGAWTATTTGTGIQPWEATTFKKNGGVSSFVTRALKGTMNAEAILERNDPIAVPKLGDTNLEWFDWYTSESDDKAVVEVKDGATWVPVDSQAESLYATDAALEFLQAPFTKHTIDLAPFAGKTVRLRFRYVMGPSVPALSTPLFGWHVDDIAIRTIRWDTLARPTTAAARLANLADGTHQFRVRTAYRNGFGTLSPGPWSSAVTATVKGVKPVVLGGGVKPGVLPATGVGAPDAAFLFLAAAALILRMHRRKDELI